LDVKIRTAKAINKRAKVKSPVDGFQSPRNPVKENNLP
jgi:hypothetical protein